MFFIYSRAVLGGGAVVSSTKSGGATTATSSSGGGTTATSSSGGGTTATSSSGGGVSKSTLSGGATTQTSSFTSPTFFVYSSTKLPLTGATFDNHTHAVNIDGELNHAHNVSIPAHSHNFDVPSHTHNVIVPNHSHDVTIPNHTHSVSIPAHTHDITLPDHTHDIEHGIFVLNRLPTKVTIKVDGNTVPYTAISGEKIDLIPYLEKDSSGMVVRGWHTVSITPNDLGRITAQLTNQFFLQSRGGGSF